jgi:protein PhnA
MGDDEDSVYDEASGEWRPASDVTAVAAVAVVDAEGNALADGDAVTLVKDLKVKGTSTTLKRGTVIRSIRLTDDPDLVDCRHETIKGLVLRTEFVRKR